MACYFWILLDENFPIGPPGPPCSSCGFIMPYPFDWNTDRGCPNCLAGAMPESALPSEYDNISKEDWEQAEQAEADSYYRDTCPGCKGQYNAAEWGYLCRKCQDAKASEEDWEQAEQAEDALKDIIYG